MPLTADDTMLQTRPRDTGRQTDWAFERSIVACGVRVGIRINKPAFVDRVLPLIPDIWKPSSSSRVERVFSLTFGASGLRRNGRSPHRLFEDQRLLTESGNLDWVLQTFERSLKSYLAEMARHRVFVHAGVVGWLGKAILVRDEVSPGKRAWWPSWCVPERSTTQMNTLSWIAMGECIRTQRHWG